MPSRFLTELEEALPAPAKPAPKPTPPKSAAPQQAFGISVHSLKGGSHPVSQPAAQRDMTRPVQQTPAEDVNYTPGQRVRHKAFGEGTVLAVRGSGASAIVEIAFDNGAEKKFASAFAPIEVL